MNVLLNGELLATDVAPAELPREASGVFETLPLLRRQPLFWSEHWERFEAGCRWYGFAPPVSSAELGQHALALAARNSVSNGVIRYAAWVHEGASVSWRVDVTPPRPHMAESSFRMRWGPTLPDLGEENRFKHLHRGAWSDALKAARVGGDHEVLLLSQSGFVVEGATANVFAVVGERVLTPHLRHRPLPGIMRAAVLSLCRQADVEVSEADLLPEDLQRADEIWLTNSLIGIRSVSHMDGAPRPTPTPVLDVVRASWKPVYGWDLSLVLPQSA